MTVRSLPARVTAAAAAVAVLVGALAAAALLSILALRKAEQRETRAKDVAVAALRVRATAADEESAIRGYALTARPLFLTLFRKAHARLPSELTALRAQVNDRVQLDRVGRLKDELQAYYDDYAQNVILITPLAPEAVRGPAASTEDRLRSSQIRATLASILTAENARARQASTHARRVASATVGIGIAAIVLSTALVLAFGIWVRRRVARPLRRLTSAASEVAAGDLTVRLDDTGAGEVGALVTAFNSMTRSLELAQRELVTRNTQLVESERHKRDLISMVSHELRTPLASVVGFTRLLLEREFGPDEQRRYLEIVDTQARRLASLAGDFLDVQLLDTGTMTLTPSRFDLVDLVREQARLFFHGAETQSLDLRVPSGPVEVDGDRDRLAQVVGNLLSNAIKYSPPESTVHVDVDSADGRAVVAVSDEGVGIAPDDRDRIFEKFFRSEHAAATVGGTGLGLAVAREIVLAHGGTIEVDSEQGGGSTFRVSLPAVSAPHLSPA